MSRLYICGRADSCRFGQRLSTSPDTQTGAPRLIHALATESYPLERQEEDAVVRYHYKVLETSPDLWQLVLILNLPRTSDSTIQSSTLTLQS